MTTTTVIVNKTEIPRITPDGRTTLAALLAGYDELYAEKQAAEQMLTEAEAAYRRHVDKIKEQVAALTPAQKVQLDSDKLACVLDYSITTPQRATAEGMAWLKVEHPGIFARITASDPVCTIRRLVGKRWSKNV